MSLTVQQLLADAKRLSGRLREHDASADNVISNAQEVLKAVDAMRQYQEDIDNLNCIAHNRPRAQLVLGIQQENRHIRQLQHENKELRASLEEHQNAIELIMSKYRQHITCLVHSSKVDKNAINQQKSRLLQDRADKICEMASVMNQSIQIDEERYAKEQELMSRLLTENKGLREMLEISAKNGSKTDPLIGPKVVSRSCQTDGLEYDPTSLILTNNVSGLSQSDTDRILDSNQLLLQRELISTTEHNNGKENDSLSDTKDKSIGTIGPSTSSPAASYTSTAHVIATANTTTSTSHVAMSANAAVSNSAGLGLHTLSNDSRAEESLSPSRPISAASDSSESSTESSTTSEEDEEQEVTFNTIKRRQTKINVISPKSASPQPHNDFNNSSSKLSTTSSLSNNENQEHCDETKYIVDSNGDNKIKSNEKSAVNDLKSSDAYDKKENGIKSQIDSNADEGKINGDKTNSTRTPCATPIDSAIKSDDKNSKKDQKNTKSACSMNTVVNSFDEHQSSLPGITLPARFKKANNKNKKSTIRKSDLRNNGCGSDTDKKVSK